MKTTLRSLTRSALGSALVAASAAVLLAACSGGGSDSGSSNGNTGNTPTTLKNFIPVTVDAGPTGRSLNVPFVSVTVCKPGTTTCATIDHVVLDTGSYGLRLVQNAALTGLNLPAVNAPSGSPAGECGQFVSGFTWGSVRSADVKLGGEVAANIPMEIIGDTSTNFAKVPLSCSSVGANLSSVASLGANGILGVGLLKEDCGTTCAQYALNVYYSCTATGCTTSKMPISSQVVNPVARFASKNTNGVILTMPNVSNSGVATLAGTLTFGLGTETNNAVPGSVYKASSLGNFKTTYKNVAYNQSFLDSGSNGLYFYDPTITACKNNIGFYCPSTPLTFTATNTASDNSKSGQVSATLVSVDTLLASMNAAPVGGTTGNLSSSQFDWGLPFFFGRSVAVAIEGQTTPAGTGPYWAY
jgi:hypothetical protein